MFISSYKSIQYTRVYIVQELHKWEYISKCAISCRMEKFYYASPKVISRDENLATVAAIR
jgi:hypothetical protein